MFKERSRRRTKNLEKGRLSKNDERLGETNKKWERKVGEQWTPVFMSFFSFPTLDPFLFAIDCDSISFLFVFYSFFFFSLSILIFFLSLSLACPFLFLVSHWSLWYALIYHLDLPCLPTVFNSFSIFLQYIVFTLIFFFSLFFLLFFHFSFSSWYCPLYYSLTIGQSHFILFQSITLSLSFLFLPFMFLFLTGITLSTSLLSLVNLTSPYFDLSSYLLLSLSLFFLPLFHVSFSTWYHLLYFSLIIGQSHFTLFQSFFLSIALSLFFFCVS